MLTTNWKYDPRYDRVGLNKEKHVRNKIKSPIYKHKEHDDVSIGDVIETRHFNKERADMPLTMHWSRGVVTCVKRDKYIGIVYKDVVKYVPWKLVWRYCK